MTAGRVPPSDLDSEAIVLAAALLDSAALDELVDLESRHFYSRANAAIWGACRALAEANAPVDAATVAAWLRDREQLQAVGGARYLAQLVDATPAAAQLEHHARRVVDLARVRAMIAEAHRIAADGYTEAATDPRVYLDAVEGRVFALARGQETHRSVTLQEAIRDTCAAVLATASGTLQGAPSGSPGVDKMTGGMRAGDLTILAGRPGMGKSAAMLDACRATARAGQWVALFSLEMPKDQVAARLLAQEASVCLREFRSGGEHFAGWGAISASAQRMSGWRIQIDDRPAVNLMHIRAECRRVERQAKAAGSRLGLIAIDYLQLMTPVSRDRGRSRENEVADMSRGLKELAKHMGAPVLALAQLSRRVEERPCKRPLLSDLRESGSLEQDADVVRFLFRDGYYRQARSEPKREDDHVAEDIISKQRNGPTGTTYRSWRAEPMTFIDLEAWELDRRVGGGHHGGHE